MELASWIVVGTVAGLLARWISPRSAPDGSVVAIPLGVSGAAVGGFVVGTPNGSGVMGVSFWPVLGAASGAVLLLMLYGLIARLAA
jgi:uncharacterized membrane protein YeaQ/YmgE (transglycosylase-associated protein family)